MEKFINFVKDVWNGVDTAIEAKDTFGAWWRVSLIFTSIVVAFSLFVGLCITLFGFWTLLLIPIGGVAFISYMIVSDLT